MGALFYITNEGSIYRGYRKDYYDKDVLELLPRVLRDMSKDSSLDALKRGLRLRWEEPYDIIIPYGDIRHTRFETVWSFDLDNDQLVFEKNEGLSGRVALSVLRQRPVTFDDFESCESPRALSYDILTTFPQPYWQPIVHLPQRKVDFARRLLEDFNSQWRHILRWRYKDLTFRKLAQATLHIATFNFNIKELTEPRQGLGGALIGPLDLPEWRPLETRISLIGWVWFVASQDPAEGLSTVREHCAAQQASSTNKYLIMCVRHVVLCRYHEGKLEWTCPVPFLNGIEPVSDHAAELLLAVTSDSPLKTQIHRLPAEVQTKILRYVSHGSVDAARVGCILGLGLPFTWKDGKMEVVLETAHRNRRLETPVESQVWFSDHFSGVAYKGDMRSITEAAEILKF